MVSINFKRTYLLNEFYEETKQRAFQTLDRYLVETDVFSFDNQNQSVTFSTERLIPSLPINRPRVMLLFSNPHPYSVHQGMFLSPNTLGRENLFWPIMRGASWLSTPDINPGPKQLADNFLKAEYSGPFDLIFYCYYAFPTDFPEDIQTIFGKEHFRKVIEPEAISEFYSTIQETKVEAVVTFNKTIFNLVSKDPVKRNIDRLIKGEIIKGQLKGIDRHLPVYLTFPTGWRYHKDFMTLREGNLDAIRESILSGLAMSPDDKT